MIAAYCQQPYRQLFFEVDGVELHGQNDVATVVEGRIIRPGRAKAAA
ncbi:MAG TPA: hypothetical protein VGM32_05510 [Rhodopila sp.]